MKINLYVRYRGLMCSFLRRGRASDSAGWPILLSRKSARQMLNPTVRIICCSRFGRLVVPLYRPPSRGRIAKT